MGGIVNFMPAYQNPNRENADACRTLVDVFICPSDYSITGDWQGQNNYVANQGIFQEDPKCGVVSPYQNYCNANFNASQGIGRVACGSNTGFFWRGETPKSCSTCGLTYR